MTTKMPLDKVVVIDYTNHRGERRQRRILPISLAFRATPHHPQAQWILEALDLEKAARRSFAFATIHSWSPLKDLLKDLPPGAKT